MFDFFVNQAITQNANVLYESLIGKGLPLKSTR